jgi:hypothetical protein
MIGGIGMALLEHSVVDPRNGRIPNANLAEYAVPVHADSPPVMDVIFAEEHDPRVNPLGVKGVDLRRAAERVLGEASGGGCFQETPQSATTTISERPEVALTPANLRE